MLKFLQALRGFFVTPARAATTGALVVTLVLFPFSDRSKINLIGVDDPLIVVTTCAHEETKGGFDVIDGMRTEEEHKVNLAAGRSWALRSRHQDGKAIDFIAKVNGRGTFDAKYYPAIAQAFADCSKKHGIPIIWGGEWKERDWGHIELDRRTYP